ncbi:pentapeptide repeat-containing protein [Haloarcula japonica]|uniref:pentapeptide repeat-containing protein n=1 Tax=Haloarcula japonica TaxID=29282 RepID=UPI0039F67AAE
MPSERNSSDSPSDRCGYTVSYLEREFWAGSVCCWRETWSDSEHCFWHAQSENKTADKIPADSDDRLERLDGAYLPKISIEEFPLTKDTTLNSVNLQGIQAPHSDLSSWILNGANLFEADLHNSNLCRAELRDANLSNANFEGADLSFAHLRQAQVVNTNLIGVNATVCSAPETKFIECELENTDFTNAYIDNAIFRGSGIKGTVFKSSKMRECDFQSASVRECNFSNSNLSNSNFCGCNLSETDFSHANLSSVDFGNCDATDAIFVDIKGLNSDFQDASVPYSDFSDAYLSHAKFENTTAISADFSDAMASHADFSYSSLDEATFRNSQLRDSNFRDATLTQADLENADLRGGSLDGASLVGALLNDVLLDEESELGEVNEDSAKEAVNVYRKFIRLLKENSLDYSIPAYRIKEREMKKKELYGNSQYLSGFTYTLLGLTSSYGESPKRVLISSAVTISVFAIIFSVLEEVGGLGIQMLDTYLPYRFTEAIEIILGGLYYSISSFVGLGPASQSPFVHFLSVLATLVGTLLIALLIFTLGRVATR